jgi:hypothetical protein
MSKKKEIETASEEMTPEEIQAGDSENAERRNRKSDRERNGKSDRERNRKRNGKRNSI